VYFTHGLLGDASDDGTEMGFWVDGIEFGCFDEGVHDGCPPSAVIGTGECPVLAAYVNGTNCSFRRIVRHVDAIIRALIGLPSNRAATLVA
jgi:hypothetical protein